MSAPPYPLIPPPLEKSWLDRHAAWKIPLAIVAGVILLCAFVGTVFTIVSYSFHKSFVFNEAIARAERNPQVVNRIGTPLKAGWLPTGNIQVSGDTGTAQMEIPVTGPRGNATIRLDARKASGTWRFSVVEIEFEGETNWISLLETSDGTGPPEP